MLSQSNALLGTQSKANPAVNSKSPIEQQTFLCFHSLIRIYLRLIQRTFNSGIKVAAAWGSLLCSPDLPCSFYLLSGSFPTGLCARQPSPRHLFPMDPKGERKLFMNGFLCKDPETIMPSDFKTSTMLENADDTDNFIRSSMDVVTAAEFPGLNTLGLSVARTDLAMDGMVLPYSHSRGSETMYVVQGTMVAGFIDTKDRPFQKILEEGDVFVIPRGLLHFCLNAGFRPATIHSVLNSQNPGVVRIAGCMFFSSHSHLSEKLVARMLSLRAMVLGHNRTDAIS